MQAIILAGGYGTRLAPVTYTIPKPLLPLLNKPMIEYIINSLPKDSEIIIASNYKNSKIKKYFEEKGMGVIINKENKPLGTGGAVKNAEKYIDGKFIVINSDIISSLNIRKMIRYHEKKKSFITISLWKVDNVEEFGVVDLLRDGKIKKFIEKPARHEAPSQLINAGTYCMEYDVLDYIEKGKFVSMEKEIFPKVIEEGRGFYGYLFDGYWTDVGKRESYLEATKFLLKRKSLSYLYGENCNIEGLVKYSTIGNNCSIGKNSIVNESIIYEDCIIGKNVEIENSIIAKKCIIKDGVKLKNVIAGEKEEIKRSTRDAKIWSKPLPRGYPKEQVGNPCRK
ncbi:MAG: NDP-sugar synthase [Thermoplasmatales archaeon]|nr:NDP-sugar synthase [Thermoplasmatales archaeon]